jgi:hypothetical protein
MAVTMKPRLGRQRVLRKMERDLAASDPRLMALFSSFTLLAQDEEMPWAEKIVAWPLRILGRLRGPVQPPGGWRAALHMTLYGPLLLCSVAGHGRAPRRARAARRAGSPLM